ncbi:MAG TPA: hypothetical protein VI072_05890 [Polyangiaceae bacterium]
MKGRTIAAVLCTIAPLSARANEAATSSLPPPSPELLAPSRSAPPVSMHPRVVLRDSAGEPVLTSGEAVSPEKSCGACHDVAWINAHSYHGTLGSDERVPLGKARSGRRWDFSPGVFGRWDPLSYLVAPTSNSHTEALSEWLRHESWRHVGGGPGAGSIERNCFLCHVKGADNAARIATTSAGHFRFAATATLRSTGLVAGQDDSFRWQRERFADDGSVAALELKLGRATDEACAFCHGLGYRERSPLGYDFTDPRLRTTHTQGIIVSPQRMSDSALNLQGKEQLARPWDVHAERMVTCTGCHFTPNHPAYSYLGRAAAPEHLRFDTRRVEIADYLHRPDHNFAKGRTAQGTMAAQLAGSLRRCEKCHDASTTHEFLPRAGRHFAALLCESCHVPKAHAPARMTTDWSLPARPGEPSVMLRGLQGPASDRLAYVTGFEPILLARRDSDGVRRVGPYNLLTTWFWIEKGPAGERPVPLSTLNQALFDARGALRPELRTLLDSNRDGRVSPEEHVLDTEIKVRTARALLTAAGARTPRLAGEIQPFGIHHGVAPGRFATRDCAACHDKHSRFEAAFLLASRVPFGVTPKLVGDANVTLSGRIELSPNGQLVYTQRAADQGLYVLGATRSRFVDTLGMALVLGAFASAALHGALRIRLARKRRVEERSHEKSNTSTTEVGR